MMEESDSRRNEPSITFPPMKTGTTHVNGEREKVSSVNSSQMQRQATQKNLRIKI